MAETSILGGPVVGKTMIQTADNGIMVFDSVAEVNHNSKMRVTKHEIESGAQISDHAVLENQIITLKGTVSNHPISLASTAVGAASTGIGGVLGGVGGALAQFGVARMGSAILNNENGTLDEVRSIVAYEILQELQLKEIPVTITTNLRVYENMMLTSLSTSSTSKTSQALVVSASFEESRFVVTDVTEIAKSQINGSKKGKKQGKKVTKPTDPAKLKKVCDSSAIKGIANAFGITDACSGVSN